MAFDPHMVINNGHICMRSTSPGHIFYKYPSLHGYLPVSSINTQIKHGYGQGQVSNDTQVDNIHAIAGNQTDNDSNWVAMPPENATAEAWKYFLVGLYSYGSNPMMAATPYSAHLRYYYCGYTRLACTIRLQNLWDFADPSRRMASTVGDWNNRLVNVNLVVRCHEHSVGQAWYRGPTNPASGFQIDQSGLAGYPISLYGQLRTTWPSSTTGTSLAATFQGRAGTVSSPNNAGYTWWDPLPPGGTSGSAIWNRRSFWDTRALPAPLVWTPPATNSFRFTSSAHLYLSLFVRANQRMIPGDRVHFAAYASDFEIEYHVTPA